MSPSPALVRLVGTGALFVALGSAIAGCTASEPSPSPSIDLEGEFLAAICPANDADLAFNEVWSAPSSSLEAIVTAAATARDADMAAIESIDALIRSWPADYGDDLAVIRRMYEAKVEDYTAVAAVTDIDPYFDLTFQNPTAGNAAYERIAQRIGTSVDEC